MPEHRAAVAARRPVAAGTVVACREGRAIRLRAGQNVVLNRFRLLGRRNRRAVLLQMDVSDHLPVLVERRLVIDVDALLV